MTKWFNRFKMEWPTISTSMSSVNGKHQLSRHYADFECILLATKYYDHQINVIIMGIQTRDQKVDSIRWYIF